MHASQLLLWFFCLAQHFGVQCVHEVSNTTVTLKEKQDGNDTNRKWN